MTLDQIKLLIGKFHVVATSEHDFELAHILEDEIHEKVLQAIADEICEDDIEAAKLALSTKNVKYQRYYA